MLLDGKRAYPKMIDGFFLLFLASNNTYINPANEAREIHEARKPTSKMISVRICRDQQGMVRAAEPRLTVVKLQRHRAPIPIYHALRLTAIGKCQSALGQN